MKRRVYVWEKKCSVNATGHDLDAIFVTLAVMEKTEKEKWKSGKDWNMVLSKISVCFFLFTVKPSITQSKDITPIKRLVVKNSD